MLDKRKSQILYAIIQSYIATGEPVGSRSISKIYDLGVSSATIRNEMADLEELGFLLQPHTSAGRVPSDKGYRLYVDEILPNIDIETKNYEFASRELIESINAIEDLTKNTVKFLSEITNYTSIAVVTKVTDNIIKKIELIKIGNMHILLILISETGTVKNKTVKMAKEVSDSELLLMIKALNDKFKGKNTRDIGEELFKELKKALNNNFSMMIPIIYVITELFDSDEDSMLFEGVSKILNYQEYNDIKKAKEFLDFIENKNIVKNILTDELSNSLNVKIGSENDHKELKENSIITTVYSLNGKVIGKLAILGPTRMDYLKVMSILKSVTNQLDNIMNIHLLK